MELWGRSRMQRNRADRIRSGRSVGAGRTGRGGGAGWRRGAILLNVVGLVLAVGLPALFRIRHVSIRLYATLNPSAEQQKRDQHSQADTNHVLPLSVRFTAAFTLLQGGGPEKRRILAETENRGYGY